MPHTVRITKPVHESIMGRLKKTFTGSSGPMSPVKGLKRLCNGDLDFRSRKSVDEASDKDADSVGDVDERSKDLVSVEELCQEVVRGVPPIHHGNGGVFPVDIGRKTATAANGDVFRKGAPVGEASKFLFKHEGRVESEEETILDNGAVGSPKIVLTSPKSNKSRDRQKGRPFPRAQTYDSGVGDSCRSPRSSDSEPSRSQFVQKGIEIVQDDDEITVVVKGNVTIHSEDISSTDPSHPKRFVISSIKHKNVATKNNTDNNVNNNNNSPAKEMKSTNSNNQNNNISAPPTAGNLSRSGSRKKTGRSSPTTGGRASPTGTRSSRSPVTSPTKQVKAGYTSDEENSRGRSSEKKR